MSKYVKENFETVRDPRKLVSVSCVRAVSGNFYFKPSSMLWPTHARKNIPLGNILVVYQENDIKG